MNKIYITQPGLSIGKNWLKRKIWNCLYSGSQYALGSFFIDPRDHIGGERIIIGKPYEFYNLEIIKSLALKLNIGTGICIDIGANIGNHSRYFAEVFSKVVCIEPGDVASSVLNANMISSGIQNYEIHKCALGSASGRADFIIVSETNLGSSQISLNKDSGPLEVKVGDELLDSHENIEFIKIDVEGFEADVLKGLLNTLIKWQPVICVEVLSESNWNDISVTLAEANYSQFMVISRPETRSIFTKIRSLFTGKEYSLAKMPALFPKDGYDMIFCVPGKHSSKLTES
jgi:FkbM family methyltransferase